MPTSASPTPIPPSTRRERTAPPASLVRGDDFAWGTYDGPVADVDLLARWSGVARRFHDSRLKEWQAFQLANPTHFVLGAVYDAKLLGLVQIVVVEAATGRARRWEGRVPSTNLSVARGLSGTRSVGRAGALRVVVGNDVPDGRLAVTADDPGSGGRGSLALDVTARCGPGEAGHLVICHPFGDGAPLYSHKAAMQVDAVLQMGAGDGEPAETVRFEAADSFLLLDDHKGHYPSPMAYDWVTGGRRERGGRLVAFNLTDNQVRDPDTYNECCLWLDDAVHRLPPVRFDRPGGVHQPWRVLDAEGRVDVTFEPTVRNEQHVGPRSVLADYYGPFGRCSGTIVADDGEVVSVDGCFGMGEQKSIRF